MENVEFHVFVELLNPRYDVPLRRVTQQRMLADYRECRGRMKEFLASNVPTKFSFTIDAWSSRVLKSYFAVTAHWIDGNWRMKSILLEFMRFESPHDGNHVCSFRTDCIEH